MPFIANHSSFRCIKGFRLLLVSFYTVKYTYKFANPLDERSRNGAITFAYLHFRAINDFRAHSCAFLLEKRCLINIITK